MSTHTKDILNGLRITAILLCFSSAALSADEPSYSFKQLKKSIEEKTATQTLTPEQRAKAWNDRLMQERDLGGAGEMPKVTKDSLPAFIENSIRNRMREPGAMEIVSWTLPKLEKYESAGEKRGFWTMDVTVRGKNGYGGTGVRAYMLVIKNNVITQCRPRN